MTLNIVTFVDMPIRRLEFYGIWGEFHHYETHL